MFVPQSRASFVVDPVPQLIVVAPPHMDALPPITVRDGYIQPCEGWLLFPRLTLCVVDGPGDAGFLVQGAADADQAEHLTRWLEALDKTGAAVVIALEEPLEDTSLDELVSLPTARGGAIPLLSADPPPS